MKNLLRYISTGSALLLFLVFALASSEASWSGVGPFPEDVLPCVPIDPPENKTIPIQVDVINEAGIGVAGITVKVTAGVQRSVPQGENTGAYCLRFTGEQAVQEHFVVTGPNGTTVLNYTFEAWNEYDLVNYKAETADASYIKNYDYGSAYIGQGGFAVLSAIKKDEL